MNNPQRFNHGRIIGAVALLLIPLFCQAATIIVTPGDDISVALASVTHGDSVLVEFGEYVVNNVAMPSGVVLAALSPEPEQYPVFYSSAETSIMRCEDLSAETRIQGIVFTRYNPPSDRLPHRGGGVYSINSGAVFSNCSFLNLQAVYGGAVYCAAGQAPSFEECSFEGNFSKGAGGAINLVGGQQLFLDRCIFTENIALGGGSVLNAALRATARMAQCTLSANGQAGLVDITAWDSDLVEIGNSIINESQGRACYGDFSSTPWFHCSDLYGNPDGDWSGALAEQAALDGNISMSPMFCGSSGILSPFELDESSPCTAQANPNCGSMGALGIGCTSSTGTEEQVKPETYADGLPIVTQLKGNHPNPFNPQTTIVFDLSRPDHASVDVYDLAGRLVRNLHSGVLAAGNHEVMWNGRGPDGRMAAAGVYFFRLKTESVIDTRRMMLVK